MAAFSSSSSLFQHHHSVMLMDSSLSSSLPVNIIVPDNNYYSTIYSKICADPIDQEPRSSEYFQLSSFINHHHHQPNLGHTSTKLSDLDVIDSNEGSFTTNKNCSTVHFTDQKKNTTMDKKRKSHEGRSSSNSAQSKDLRSSKGKKKQKKAKRGEETEEKDSTGYVHVRARRGQATDSHSLAERVRREKISERMKLLQALVPGCEKVTGKALMLDEIINYVQSLQSQVEFLSMKLASVNPILYDFGMDLESLMARPDQDLNSLPSPLPNMQQCSLRLTTNHYPMFMNNSTGSLQFHHAQYH